MSNTVKHFFANDFDNDIKLIYFVTFMHRYLNKNVKQNNTFIQKLPHYGCRLNLMFLSLFLKVHLILFSSCVDKLTIFRSPSILVKRVLYKIFSRMEYRIAACNVSTKEALQLQSLCILVWNNFVLFSVHNN